MDNVLKGDHYWVNKSRQEELDLTVNDSDRCSIHYPAYYTITCQHKKELNTVCLFTVSLLPLIVFFSREI